MRSTGPEESLGGRRRPFAVGRTEGGCQLRGCGGVHSREREVSLEAGAVKMVTGWLLSFRTLSGLTFEFP